MLQNIKVNLSGVTRHDTMAGRDYLVASAVMIVEGVLDGSHGPLLYPADELKKSVPLWNNKPAVLYHPEANGEGISACDPVVITNRGLGVLMNTSFEDNKLKTEVWLDMERVKAIDERVLEAVENQEVMELSTGLLTDDDDTPGEFNGIAYDSTARNYRPDHLAILPDQIGACSIEDGAGFLRLNKAGDKLTFTLKESTVQERMYLKENKKAVLGIMNKGVREFLDNEMSDGDRRGLLQSLLSDKFPDEDFGPWIDDIFSDDDFFVYEKDGKLFKQEFEEDGKGVLSLSGIPIAVTKQVTYPPITNKETVMSKKKLIGSLISNKKTLWSEDNREWLLTQDKEILKNMVPVANDDDDDDDDQETSATETQAAGESQTQAAGKTETGDVAESKSGAAEADAKANMTVNEYIAKAPKEIQDMLNNGMASHKADRKRLMNVITANDSNSFTDEMLETKSLAELAMLAKLARNGKTVTQDQAVMNYGGLGDAADLTENKEEPLALPKMNFAPANSSN